MTDFTRIAGFVRDISRRVRALRDKPAALVLLRAVDLALQKVEQNDETDDSPLAIAMRETVRDIEAEERAEDGAHERARDAMVPSEVSAYLAGGPPHVRVVVDELAQRRADASDIDPRCPGCGETNPAHCHCGVDDPVAEFEPDQHRTRLDSTPEVIALCEQTRERDPDREVDLLFDVSDAEEPVAVHGPGGEIGGECDE